MNRSTEYRRDARNRKIRHRKYICKNVYRFDWYKHDGQYSKGKIHCGCGICKYSRRYGLPTIKDEREKSKADSDLQEYYNN